MAFRSFPSEIQLNTNDCGATCIKIISKFYGVNVPLPFLRKITSPDRVGISLLSISKAAEQIGFNTLGVRVTFEKFINAPLPAIVHWNQNHFIVVYKISKKKVFISDPAVGLYSLSYAEFLKGWIGENAKGMDDLGVCILIKDTPSLYENNQNHDLKSENILYKYVYRYFLPFKSEFFHVFIGLVIVNLLQLAFPILTQCIVDIGIGNNDIGFVWTVLLAQLLITFGKMSIELSRSWILLKVGNKLNLSLISDFLAKLMRLPISYFDSKKIGDLVQRISDHSRIQDFLSASTLTTAFSLFSFVMYSVIIGYYSMSLLFIFLVGSVIYFIWTLLFMRRRKVIDNQRFAQSGKLNSKIFELLSGIQEIKLHNAENQKRWGWEKLQISMFGVANKSLILEQIQSIGSRVINEIKNIFISVFAAQLVIDGHLTLGMMLSVSYMIGQLNTPIAQFVSFIKSWQDASLSIGRLNEIHEIKDEIKAVSSDNSNLMFQLPDKISFKIKEMTFGYSDETGNVLEGISAEIEEGKVTAIVGASGSGKSTLIKLLMNFYIPSSGGIFINNVDIKNIDVFKLREKIGVVMQEGFIFNDSIAGNIAVGDDYPDAEKLLNAAKIANILEFINSLPQNFYTKIGSDGVSVSTGQKQRILIARAVYKDPSVLFFDEATSALDANNEKVIMKNLQEFYKNKTVVIVAHRLSTVVNADNIIVLDKGQIIEEGNHKNLIERKGMYYNLIKNQLELGS